MNKQSHFLVRRLAALVIASAVCPLQAAPVLPQVVNGQATFSQQGNVFSITNSPNAVINWQSFNVNAGEVTRFIQQSGDSAVLNRIVGQDPSRILGALQSNGHVFLINPNGILFGRDSRVDVNGLTASTLGMTNADFLAGKNSFRAGPVAGHLVQQGSITTPTGGKVFLIAPNVTNNGVITSPQGQVMLAAGRRVELVDSGNPDLHVVVAAPADQAINLGQILAQGGAVGIYGALVNQRGVVNANSAQVGPNGKIVLRASIDAMLEAGSITSANGAGTGGQVTVEGERVGMTGNAAIDVSGAAGGGTVLLGGGYQGKNPLVNNAQHTLLGSNASIRADATTSGNGGTVVLWGQASTGAHGLISARGGALGGNGGLVETSGKYLDVNGIRVNAGASARGGANGTWLLDPYDIDVVALNGSAGLGEVDQFADPASFATIDAAMLSSVAPGTNVVLQAQHDVRFSAAVTASLGSGSLSVEAGNSIFVDARLATGGGDLGLTANHPSYASGTGQIIVGPNGSIDTGGGKVDMNATGVIFDGALSTGNGRLNVTARDILFGSTGSTGSLADGGTGAMLFNATGGTFALSTNWTLRSAGAIGIQADYMNLQGMIGASAGVRPSVTFTTYTAGKDLDLSVGRDSSALQLNPAWLATLDVAHLQIGAPSHTGIIHVYSAYEGGLASKLTLNTGGEMWIAAPITLPAGTDSTLELLVSGSNDFGAIHTRADVNNGIIIPGGHLAADNLSLRANNMMIGASMTGTGAAGGKVSLGVHMPSAQMQLGVGAIDSANVLGLDDSELALISTRSLSLGSNGAQGNGLSVTSGGMDFSTILPAGSSLLLGAGLGELTFNGSMSTGGQLYLYGQHVGTAGMARVKAKAISISSFGGIGADNAPFSSETAYFSAANHMGDGGAVINVSNTGALVLGSVRQSGAGNQGAISISNAGTMTLPALEGAIPNAIVSNGNGAIALKSTGALTIDGIVSSDSGPILVEAANGAQLTIGASGKLDSSAGNIDLIGGDVLNNGSVTTLAGNINVGATTVTGSGAYSAPGGTITGVISTIPQCLADPIRTGCTSILKLALDACIADPSGQYCSALLPTMTSCIADPSIYGCGAVLPKLALCIADPSVIGCSAVLPTLSACIADPSVIGCSAVLPTLSACIADPSKPGCSVVLPTLAACVADPSKAGCSVVLPTLAACVADPSKAGCSVVLPTLAACVADPSKAGCSVVLPTLAACVADPSKAGCSVVLPTLAACVADPSKAGCSVVLPTLAACIAAPTKAGCTTVLPTLAQCVASPSLQGCAVILPTPDICAANPTSPICQLVTPTAPLPTSVVTTVVATTANAVPPIVDASAPGKVDDKKSEKVKDEADKTGVRKDEVAKKTFCN